MTLNSTINSEPLNIETLPLTGVRLIEASAGTGKTYTISSIYVRLILGHQCTPLSPENILVVTFTRAATEELRDRIRKRLKQVLQDFEKGDSSDPFVAMLLQTIDDLKLAVSRLKDAIQLMDLASIYTIHSFAQRLLRQHGVEANVSSEFELILDETDILLQAVQDVWRSNVYPLTGPKLDLLLSSWKTPDDLLRDCRGLLYKDVSYHLGEKTLDFDKAQSNYSDALNRLLILWKEESVEFIQSILQHPDANGTFKKGLPSKQKTIDKLVSGQAVKFSDAEKALAALTPLGMQKSVKKGGDPIEHRINGACQTLLDYLVPFEQAKDQALREWRVNFIEQIKVRLKFLKQQKQLVATDDLLLQLNQAFKCHSEDRLLTPIRQQFPVALVDEFQDTDAVQYDVFRTLYVSEKHSEQLGLFMIGDPKQAIYKFRGADIFTYIQAKQEVEKSYSLDTNYRSTKFMVDAVNHIFTRHDQSFIYNDSIPFSPVKAKDSAQSLMVESEDQAACVWRYINGDKVDIKNKSQLSQALAEDCAEQITQLLNQGLQHQATFENESLKAKDIAILVRNRNQAQLVKECLTDRGVGCVYVGQDNVFDSSEAQGLLMLLKAVHAVSEKAFRNAIAHPIWQKSLSELKRFMLQEHLWEQQLDQLYQCHEIWNRQGVMPMLMHWIHQQDLASQWLSKPGGERTLTNFLHLGELLQQAASELQGMQGLLSWYDQQVTSALVGDGEQKQLRLESDANLVQIVTIHKSKGLEYPIVFLPFLWDGKESTDEVFYDEELQTLRCDLVGDFQQERIREGLAEEIRLLYVALTRAASQCHVSIPEIPEKASYKKAMLNSALWFVLFQQRETEVLTAIKSMVSQESNSVFSIQTATSECSQIQKQETYENYQAKHFNGEISKDWQLSSFSSLVRHHHAPHSARFNLDDEESLDGLDLKAALEQKNGFTFPKGAHAGNFLHTLLEEIEFTEPVDNMVDLDDLISDLLERFGIELEWLDTVKAWLSVILSTPLQHGGLRLDQLSNEKKLVEMEFYFPIQQLTAHDFNRLLKEYSVLSVPVQDVEFKTIKGMLKGFIDLTFVWNEQYFVLDYKSNHLGMAAEDYQQVAMEHAMAEHRYDIQLVLYTLALHRMLKLRVPDYEYEKHIGGGYYLFLRGMNTSGREGQFFHKPDQLLIEALDRLIDGQGENQAAASSSVANNDLSNQMDLLG